jgi:signal transduction histidine kinase
MTSRIPALPFERSEQRVVAGVCGGIAAALGVDATLVRLVFALLALAGGAGILLYLALWLWTSGARPVLAVLLVALAAMALLGALGFSPVVVLGLGLIVAGIVLLVRRGASLRPGGSFTLPGIVLALVGAVLLFGRIGPSGSFVAPGALAGALLLVLVPWIWQVARERSDRIRMQERAEVAARIHDSVLQTLALVQREADDPQRVRALARRQERELRRWLYGSGVGSATTLGDALAEAVAEVEEAYGVRVELASAGDVPLDEPLAQVVLAAREALTNAAKHSGADEIAVYTEVAPEAVFVFVRDRGVGFTRGDVAADRRGLTDSVEARMARAGGRATITSAPGDGTEVELTIPRQEEA